MPAKAANGWRAVSTRQPGEALKMQSKFELVEKRKSQQKALLSAQGASGLSP
jgi:hypothetical protein